MTKDGIISAIIAIVLFVVGSAVSPGWLTETFAANPIGAALCVSIAFMIGYSVCLLAHHKFVRLEDELEQLRKENAEKTVYIKVLESKNEQLNAQIDEMSDIPTHEPDDHNGVIDAIDIDKLSRELEKKERYDQRMKGIRP